MCTLLYAFIYDSKKVEWIIHFYIHKVFFENIKCGCFNSVEIWMKEFTFVFKYSNKYVEFPMKYSKKYWKLFLVL